MFLRTLSLALASLALAQDSSSSPSSSAAISSQTQSSPSVQSSQTSTAVQSTSQFTLPLYPPYPISSTTQAPSASPSASPSPSAVSSSSSISSYQSDKYWQHSYRDYYASIVTVLSTSTLVYKIDCAPNSAHPSFRQPDFVSFDVCAARIVGRGPMTVTQAPNEWKFVIAEVESTFNLTQTRFNEASTSTRLDVTCEAMQSSTHTCSNNVLISNATSTSAVAAPSFPSASSGRRRASSVSISGDGAIQQYSSEVSALLENFSTQTEVYVTVTGGFDQLNPSIISSLINEASGIPTVRTSDIASPSAGASGGIRQSASTAGAAARPTGAANFDLMFGAAGLLGAAVFGL
ncbi:hypothetical protein ACN47E_002522 [Coniothyrium glycines]